MTERTIVSFLRTHDANSKTPPSGKEWLHEIKHDGFCSILRKEGKRVKLYSRPGRPDLQVSARHAALESHASLIAKSSHVGGASSAGVQLNEQIEADDPPA
jgi:hypothetical protein